MCMWNIKNWKYSYLAWKLKYWIKAQTMLLSKHLIIGQFTLVSKLTALLLKLDFHKTRCRHGNALIQNDIILFIIINILAHSCTLLLSLYKGGLIIQPIIKSFK